MEPETGITAIAHAIQLAVAPVFLLLGIGTMLVVMTNRLARIVDRARVLQGQVRASGLPAEAAALRESGLLARRGRLISRSIAFLTGTALLICATVAVLFAGSLLRWDTSPLVAVLFIAAMLTAFVGLVQFLREVFLAMAGLRLGLDEVPGSGGTPPDGGRDPRHPLEP